MRQATVTLDVGDKTGIEVQQDGTVVVVVEGVVAVEFADVGDMARQVATWHADRCRR